MDILARLEQNLADSPLAGFVTEGLSPYGTPTANAPNTALLRAVYSGMPVVAVGRGNNEGFTGPRDVFLGGNNLTATKARLLLMACLMKFGSLPPAADPSVPPRPSWARSTRSCAPTRTCSTRTEPITGVETLGERRPPSARLGVERGRRAAGGDSARRRLDSDAADPARYRRPSQAGRAAERRESGEDRAGRRGGQMATTVRESTFELLRAIGLTTVFGNPGSTELPFLKDFPEDFTYVLGLQEASVVAMADGYAQASGRAALVSLHTAIGVGNGMGNVATAYHNKTPLVITAGQQVRAMLPFEPFLFAKSPTELPRPYVKWSYAPARPQDVAGRPLARLPPGDAAPARPRLRLHPDGRLGRPVRRSRAPRG